MTSAWGWVGFRSYTCRNMLSRRNSRYQGPEAELSWESKGSVAVNGQERNKQEPHGAGFQPLHVRS